MNVNEQFEGFSPECIDFYRDLTKNNETGWFNSHRDDYDRYVLEPSRQFVLAMGDRLYTLAPGIVADPKVNRSLFRIHRDTRFSKDKSPYKTQLALWFWEGTGPRMECTGFYFHLEPDRLMLGVGIYMFPKPLHEKYREWVVDSKRGKALVKAIGKVADCGYAPGGKHYKRVPRGYDSGHERAEYLLYNGLYAGIDMDVPEELFSTDLVNYCFMHFEKMLPIHKWLLDLTG